MTSNDQKLLDCLLSEPWYHTIELAPQVFSPGKDHRNIALTRELLRRTEIENNICIDIGTADGFVPLLFQRRQAGRAIGQDFDDRSERIAGLQKIRGETFEYLPGVSLYELRNKAKEQNAYPADVVVLSGVIDHMLDPISGLAIARGLVRTGGIVIVETSAVINERLVAYANASGRFFQTSNYWGLTLGCLDYWLRVFRLQPIDHGHMRLRQKNQRAFELCRFAVACRAVDEPLVAANDEWGQRSWGLTVSAFLDWSELRSVAPPVPYAGHIAQARPNHKAVKSLDLHAGVLSNEEFAIDDPSRQSRLAITDQF